MEELTDWKLIRYRDLLFVESQLLKQAGFMHGFLTKDSMNKVSKKIIEDKFINAEHYSVKQVHGNNIASISEIKSHKNFKSDGIISESENQCLWIYTADCIPIFFSDLRSGKVCAIHSGWKGLNNRIIQKTLKLYDSYNCNYKDLLICLGPSIGKKNYPVGKDVAQKVIDGIEETSETKASIKYTLKQKIAQYDFLTNDPMNNKVLLDIRLAAKQQLINLGVNKSQISICPYCTYKEIDLFNSWRRTRKKSVQWSYIISKKPQENIFEDKI